MAEDDPFIVVEVLTIAGEELVRSAMFDAEMDAHVVADALTKMGSKVWLFDLSLHDTQRYRNRSEP